MFEKGARVMIFSTKERGIIKSLIEEEKHFIERCGLKCDVVVDYVNTLWGIELKLGRKMD